MGNIHRNLIGGIWHEAGEIRSGRCRKGFSFGPRERGSNAAEFYTSVKTAYTFAG